MKRSAVLLAAIAILLAIYWSSSTLARSPRPVRLGVHAEGDRLRVEGAFGRELAWLGRSAELTSDAPDAKLDIEGLRARSEAGEEFEPILTGHGGGTVARFDAASDRLTYLLPNSGFVVRDNLAVGLSDSDGTALLPVRRFFFGVKPTFTDAARTVDEELLERGLFACGAFRVRPAAAGKIRTLAHPSVPESEVERLQTWLSQALEFLMRCGAPPPASGPILVITPPVLAAARVDFRLGATSEVYVVEASLVQPCESTFRDLARAAAERVALRRPRAERALWRSMAASIALGLEERVDATSAAAEYERVARSYESIPPINSVPSEDRSFVGEMAWMTEDVVAPRLWRQYWSETYGDPAPWTFLAGILADSPDVPVEAWVLRLFGAANVERFESLLRRPGVHVRQTSESDVGRFPFAAPPTAMLEGEGRSRRVRVLFSALGMGFLDNCGCVLSQSGGLPRRRTMIEQARARDPETLVLELGDFLAPPLSDLSRTRAQADAVIEILGGCRYTAVVPGLAELSADPDWFVEASRVHGLPLSAANVRRIGAADSPWPEVVALQTRDAVVHVVGIVEPSYDRYRRESVEKYVEPNWRLEPPLEALRRALAQARREDVWIVAGTLTPQTVASVLDDPIAEKIDAIFSSAWRLYVRLPHQDDADTVALLSAPEVGRHDSTYFAYPLLERFGLTTSLLEFDRAGELRLGESRGSRLPPSVERHPEAIGVLDRLATLEAGDPATWLPSPLADLPLELAARSGYLGSDACLACHTVEHAQWNTTGHARAVNALAARGREFDPACLRCHTTGFRLGGFEPGREDRTAFENVQCETCHGPARAHVEGLNRGARPDLALRRSPGEDVCVPCHDPANSPLFDFAKRAPRVRHTLR